MKKLLLLPLLFFAVSCSPSFEAPEVSFQQLTNLKIKGNTITCRIILRIKNRDTRKFSFRVIDCLVYNANTAIGTLSQSKEITLAGGEHIDSEFDLRLSKQQALGSLIMGFLSKKLVYEIRGSLSYKYLIFRREFHFSETFSIDSDQLLK